MSTDGGINLPGLLADLVVATLFSADSLGTLPWVQALLAKGLGTGSAMSLLVAAVGTNVSTRTSGACDGPAYGCPLQPGVSSC
jgi:uncharacterized membrane protein YraQ (UPF0718 family)